MRGADSPFIARAAQLKDTSKYTVGQQLNPEELFKAGDLVDVQGTSIGKGFQGGVKRHG